MTIADVRERQQPASALMRAATKLRFQLLLSLVSLAGAGQELPQASAPALTPNMLQALPLEPGRRSILEAEIRTRDYKAAEQLLAEEAARDPGRNRFFWFWQTSSFWMASI